MITSKIPLTVINIGQDQNEEKSLQDMQVCTTPFHYGLTFYNDGSFCAYRDLDNKNESEDDFSNIFK